VDPTLPTNFIPLYEGLLRSVSGKLLHNLEYCALAPRCGGDYAPGGLMFYGRATNGWIKESSFKPDHLKDPTRLARLAEKIVANAQKPICTPEGEEAGPHERYRMREDKKCDKDPMHWLKHNRTNVTERRSQYWRCVKEIAQSHLGVSDEIWYRHVAWSNLYKIGPQQDSTQPAGNPSGGLQKVQRADCAHILMDEVRHFRPGCIIFLTEVNEATGYFDDFSEWLTPKVKRNLGLKYVSAAGRLQSFDHGCNIVLAQHPQGRPSSSVAKDLLKAMSSF
jgi:hypothetical protein